MRSNSQRALARDIEGFGRFGRSMGRTGLGWPTSTTQRNRSDIEEGLDERGEAPPPYVPGSKPPSLRDVEMERRASSSSEHSVGEAVELQPVNGEVEHPPGYNEHSISENYAGIARPDTAVTASETFSSTRRLMGHRSSSSGQDESVVR
ncbi:hypothetical protein NA56DRAFT_45469 [Hyaloscypha hepaticicola]|uniref:Uncharacterized protein n=1 Tax=Hyaloscypha hepaticicola TaxID=2082293 RepID=A0A2J6QBN4_9HELO|nr:hypothetical protein NA56DRAFT_45469 [Hyaloscypha hepaticicola]